MGGNKRRRFEALRISPAFNTSLRKAAGKKELQVQSVWQTDVNGGVWKAGTYGRGLFHFSEAGVTNVALPGLASGHGVREERAEADRAGRLGVGTMIDAGSGSWRTAVPPAYASHTDRRATT